MRAALPGQLHQHGASQMNSPAATYDLGKLHGGLRLPAEKAAATATPIRDVPLPDQLVLPITQHAGKAAHPIVGIGERVLKGQLIAEAFGTLSAPVHASSSGKIVAIEPWPVSRRRGDNAPCIVIDCDGEDRAIELPDQIPPFHSLDPESLLQKILQGGIVGLGGAVFPTGQKLMQAATMPLDYLILNGVECEPYISCDDLLMREQASLVLGGAQILMHALRLGKCYVVIESDKPEAIQAIGEALATLDDNRITLKQIPTIYPSGGEDQLVQLVTNREVPSGGLPTDVGCVVQNVGTAAAIYRWICEGEPLISRVTTVTGPGVNSSMNVSVRIGTTVADVISFAGGYTENADQLVIGGPMCGKSVTTDRVPVVKATNCILVLNEKNAATVEQSCIRCGECAIVCPIQLLPQQLFWYACADNESKLRSYGLTDCIECGCCDLVCPSHISLTASFRNAKARIHEQADEKARAERARRRFESRNERLEFEKQTREMELALQKKQAKSAGPSAIEEILERQRQKQDKED
ncbi:MAG: electron transport complex subunit RsxC [Proteobacteria bacterium]|nr:electron transport complex subunit RsxC [Pseudomonadota bacterium]MDA0992924.1 electron transport complex subunit RsxC [Pseudomonadota bacterium]